MFEILKYLIKLKGLKLKNNNGDGNVKNNKSKSNNDNNDNDDDDNEIQKSKSLKERINYSSKNNSCLLKRGKNSQNLNIKNKVQKKQEQK